MALILGPAVDITNYVMLELGQPMHAFDLAKITVILWCEWVAGENLVLLDDSTVTFAADTLVIADQTKPLAMAGIMVEMNRRSPIATCGYIV